MGKRKRQRKRSGAAGRGPRRKIKRREEPVDAEFVRRVRNKLWLVFFGVIAAIVVVHVVGPPLLRWSGLSKLKVSSPPTYQPYVPPHMIPGARPRVPVRAPVRAPRGR